MSVAFLMWALVGPVSLLFLYGLLSDRGSDQEEGTPLSLVIEVDPLWPLPVPGVVREIDLAPLAPTGKLYPVGVGVVPEPHSTLVPIGGSLSLSGG